MPMETEDDRVPVPLLSLKALRMRPEEIDTYVDGMIADTTEMSF